MTASSPPSTASRSAVVASTVRWAKRLLIAFGILMLLGATTAVLVVRHYSQGLPSTQAIESHRYRPPQVTRVLARDGKTVLATLYTERRTWVPISKLPPRVKLAFLAAEDAHFYEHAGVNYLGILRALVVNLRSGKTRQGASTITQQVVKNILLEPERTYRRKIREVLLAHRIEKKLSKDQILELYLNQIYLGHGRYGVEEASRYYFGKPAAQMTLAQAATLAGIVANPERFSRDADLTRKRRLFVLKQMKSKGFIDEAMYEQAVATDVTFRRVEDTRKQIAPEAVSIAKRLLAKVAGPGATLGGYTIITTIDPTLQRAAREAVRWNLEAYDRRHRLQAPFKKRRRLLYRRRLKPFHGTPKFEEHRVLVGVVEGANDKSNELYVRVGTVRGVVHLEDYERYLPRKGRKRTRRRLKASEFAQKGTLLRVSLLAPAPKNPERKDAPRIPLRLEIGPESALVALDVRSRDVLALVGSYEGQPGGLDRATQAKRQPGSTFKPIVYSYAIHTRRFTAASVVETDPSSLRGYRARNYDAAEGKRPMRLREALAHSVNVAAVHVLRDVGAKDVVRWARNLGITTRLHGDLSLALGAYEVRPIEMANVYATFAAGGVWKPTRIVKKILDSSGREVPLPSLPPERRVMSQQEAFIITSMLTSVIDHGTGARAKRLRRPLAGKTGTTNASKDAWFVGYSTDIACAVWTGFDDAISLGWHETGASAALPAWIRFMGTAHRNRPATDFPRPPSVRVVSIDPETGLLAREGQEDAIDEVFLEGTEPQTVAPEDAGTDGDAGSSDAGVDGPVEAGQTARMEQDAGEQQPGEMAGQKDAGSVPMLPPPEDTVPLF